MQCLNINQLILKCILNKQNASLVVLLNLGRYIL